MPTPDFLRVYRSRRMAVLVGLGFASGLPNVLAGDTLSAWLSSVKIDVESIGLFSLIGLPYALKFLWAPLMDRFVPPGLRDLGRRRGWLALTQALLAICLVGLSIAGPTSASTPLGLVAVFGTALVILSASQDIVADAYRTDVVEHNEHGAGAAVFVSGYRIATIIGGAFALIIAGKLGWRAAYGIMALLMLSSVVVTLLAPRPNDWHAGPSTIEEAVVQPVLQFVKQRGWLALLIVIFVIVFRLPDLLAQRMTMPLLIQQLKFTPEQVGWIRQFLGFIFAIIGALAGGGIVARIGLFRSLVVFGLLQMLSNAGFLLLANSEPNLATMATVIAVENFCGGMVGAGFVAFLMSCCDRRYSATQYALLSACMAIGQSLGGALTGYAVARMGYASFFLWTIIAGVPGMLMLPLIRRSIDSRVAPEWDDESAARDGYRMLDAEPISDANFEAASATASVHFESSRSKA